MYNIRVFTWSVKLTRILKALLIIPVMVPNFSVQLASATPIPLHYNIMILLLLRRAAVIATNHDVYNMIS